MVLRDALGGLRQASVSGLLADPATRLLDTASTEPAPAGPGTSGLTPPETEEMRKLVGHVLEVRQAGRPGDCLDAIAALDPAMREHGRTRLLEARARLAEGERERAARIMESLVVEDLADQRDTVLGELWDALHPGAALPAHLDFRMTGTGGAGDG